MVASYKKKGKTLIQREEHLANSNEISEIYSTNSLKIEF